MEKKDETSIRIEILLKLENETIWMIFNQKVIYIFFASVRN
jgi:hypothetical protein